MPADSPTPPAPTQAPKPSPIDALARRLAEAIDTRCFVHNAREGLMGPERVAVILAAALSKGGAVEAWRVKPEGMEDSLIVRTKHDSAHHEAIEVYAPASVVPVLILELPPAPPEPAHE